MTLLNEADAIFLGDVAADAVYLGDTLVWTSAPPPWDGWTPAGMTGLVAWLDGADVEAITTQWPDKSGQGHHGTIVGSPPPAVVSNSPTKRKVVRFSAGQGRVRGTIPDLTTDFTIIYVARMVGPTAGRVFGATLDAGKNYWMGFHTTGLDGWMYGNGSMFRGPTPYGALPSPWRLYTAMAGVTSGTQSSGFWVDGALLAPYTGGPVDLGPGTTYNLSGYEATGTGETSDSEVAELLIFNRGISSGERMQIEEYLAAKWGLTVVWTPKSIPNLMTWIDPSKDFFLEGQKVLSYTEHSAARRVFTTDGVNTPIFHVMPPRLEFPSTHVGLVTHGVNLGLDGLTFVIVCRAADNDTYPMKVVSGPDADGWEFRNNGGRSEIVERYATHGIVFAAASPDPTGVDVLYVMRVYSGVRTDVWVNSSFYQDRAAAAHNAPLDLWIARREGGYYWRGMMAEVLVYAGPISDADLTKLRDYLVAKHGLLGF